MIWKILAVASLVGLPYSIALWHKSHNKPEWYRYDVTLDKSLWIYLKDGRCGLELLSLPTKTASSTEFRSRLDYQPAPIKNSFLLTSKRNGPYRRTWLVFPFWFTTLSLSLLCMVPIVRGPIRTRWRNHYGLCVECGYDLRGNRSHRCPECGTTFSPQGAKAPQRRRPTVID